MKILVFIIVGVWREENRLIYYNGDLTDRVVSIDADAWTTNDLRKVSEEGQRLLNVQFSNATIENVVKYSLDNVYLLQEACYRICNDYGATSTRLDQLHTDCADRVEEIIASIVGEQAGRYMAFLNNFAEGFQQTELAMYKWLVYSIIITPVPNLEKGLRRSEVSAKIKARHPLGSSLNEGNITQALQSAADLQVQKRIRPIVIDYDATTRVLHVVDRSFLIGLSYQDRSYLKSEVGLPLD